MFAFTFISVDMCCVSQRYVLAEEQTGRMDGLCGADQSLGYDDVGSPTGRGESLTPRHPLGCRGGHFLRFTYDYHDGDCQTRFRRLVINASVALAPVASPAYQISHFQTRQSNAVAVGCLLTDVMMFCLFSSIYSDPQQFYFRFCDPSLLPTPFPRG